MLWPETELARLRVLWLDGVPLRRISDELCRSKNSIQAQIYRLGLPRRPSPMRVKGSGKSRVKRVRKESATLPGLEGVRTASGSSVGFSPAERLQRLVRGCAWLEGQRPDWIRCDAPVQPGSSWCRAHHRRAYMPRRGIAEPVATEPVGWNRLG